MRRVAVGWASQSRTMFRPRSRSSRIRPSSGRRRQWVPPAAGSNRIGIPAPTIRKPSSTSSSPHPTKDSSNAPRSMRVRRGVLTFPVQKSNGSVMSGCRASRSDRSSRNRNRALSDASSHCGPISTLGSVVDRWNARCASSAARSTVMSSSINQQISPRAIARPALRAAARPRFGCQRQRTSHPGPSASSAADEPSVDPSSTTTISTRSAASTTLRSPCRSRSSDLRR